MNTHHKLKIHPPFFASVKRGDKPFEIRKNDRNFKVGDVLELEEWIPCEVCSATGLVRATGPNGGGNAEITCQRCSGRCGRYTGSLNITRKVTFILDSEFGLKDGYVAMGLGGM